jgi:ATP synthase protein I
MRVTIYRQLVATVVMAVLSGIKFGMDGAVSAFLGGVVSIASVVVFAFVVSRYSGTEASGVLIAALKAEAAKIAVYLVLLWLVLAFYKNVSMFGFIATFVITVLISSRALFVAENKVVQIR